MLRKRTCFTIQSLDGSNAAQAAVVYEGLLNEGWTLAYEKVIAVDNSIKIVARWDSVEWEISTNNANTDTDKE